MSYSIERRQSTTQTAKPLAQRDGPASIIDHRTSAATHLQLKQKIDESPIASASRSIKQLMTDEELEGAAPAQLMEDEDETLKGKFEPVQRAEFEDDEELLHGKFAGAPTTQLAENLEARPNNTGLPDNLKSGIENLSGMSMDHVKVHYNSSQPAQLNAYAYAQGSDIHVAPGRERHLPHEAWHVVQQAQGRVRPTVQMKGMVPVNDDAGLEAEADHMGSQALAVGAAGGGDLRGPGAAITRSTSRQDGSAEPVQRVINFDEGVNETLAKEASTVEGGDDFFRHWSKVTTQHLSKAHVDGAIELFKLNAYYLARRAKLVDSIEAHEKMQLSGQRNSTITALLAEALSLDSKIATRLSAWILGRDTEPWVLALIEQLNSFPYPEMVGELDTGTESVPAQLPVVRDDGAWGNEQFKHLAGKKAILETGELEDVKIAIDEIREKDDENPRRKKREKGAHFADPALKGPILYSYIKNNRRAIIDLVAQLGDSVAIFSLERGGSFLADLISDRYKETEPDKPLPNVKVPKSAGGVGKDYQRNKHHLMLVARMMETEEGQMFRRLSRRPELASEPPPITIAIAETAVSGSSVNTLLKTLANYQALLPHSRYNLLVEKQTITEAGIARGLRGGLRHTDPGISLKSLTVDTAEQVRMFIAQVEYILGEDVGYQISYDGRLAGQPLMIFDETQGRLIAARLSNADMLPRDMLRALIAGAFDEALASIFEQ